MSKYDIIIKHNNYLLLLCRMSDNWQHVSVPSHFNQAIIRSNIVDKEGYKKHIMLRTELKKYSYGISYVIKNIVSTLYILKLVYKI